MKDANKKKIFDILYCVVMIIAAVAVSALEFFDWPLPQWLITKLPLTDSLFVMLQIQVTIAVLPLAIIALITGISKDSLYGVPVIKYAMYLRPVLLKYRRVAIIQMLMIIVSFIFTSFELYNHLELCLFITIGNSVIMMVDCFSLLSDNQCYKAEIRTYLTEKPTAEKFAALTNDIVKSKSTISTEDLKDNLSVLNEMLFTASNTGSSFDVFKSEYTRCASKLFSSKDSDIFLCAADALQAAYCKFNEDKNESNIFNTICFEFYNGLKYLNLEDTCQLRILYSLRSELFQNAQNADYNNNYQLCSFTAQMYQFAVENNIYPLNSSLSKEHFVAGLYDCFSPFQDFSILERRDRLNFFKALVDNRNELILNEKVYNITDIRPDNDLTDKLFIILYLYYIALCEPLADEDQIQFCQQYISSNRDRFKQLIIFHGLYYISITDIKLSYAQMRVWEVTKINCVKALIFESVVNDFWTFSSLAAEPLGYSLFDTLGKITEGKEFELYSQCFADDATSQRTEQKYINFCNLFGFKIDHAKIDLLKTFLSEVYKQSSIQEAEHEHRVLIEKTDFVPEQIRIVQGCCDRISNHFSNRPAEVVTNHIVLFDSEELCVELTRKGNKRFQQMIRTSILSTVCQIILPHLNTAKVKSREPICAAIDTLSKDCSCNSVNTAIGGSNCFSYQEHNKAKQIMEGFDDIFLSRYIRDGLFFISQTELFVDFNNIEVHLQEIPREEILEGKTPDEMGIYPYVITNNLMGYFTEDELVTFLQKRMMKLKVTCDLTYGFSSECIGYGIILQ